MNQAYPIVLEGTISIMAALRGRSRDILSIWIDDRRKQQDRRAHGELEAVARERGVPIEYVAKDTISEFVRGKTSGGVIAFATQRRYLSAQELLCGMPRGLWAALEGFEDPYNYGYAVRALYAAGFDGLMTSRRAWNDADAVYVKASAGASELMPTAWIEDYDDAISCLRRHRTPILCAGQSGALTTVFDSKLVPPLIIVIGGEKRGISKQFLDAADGVITIPYGRPYAYALPGVAAVSVIAFEALRQIREIAQESIG